jgi:hypothetical protein
LPLVVQVPTRITGHSRETYRRARRLD